MNWEAIGAIGEITGAVAVVATLFYLAIQIRHSSKIAVSSTRQGIAEAGISQPMAVATGESLAELIVLANAGEEPTPAQSLRLGAFVHAHNRHIENIYFQYRTGMMAEDEWQGFRRNLKFLRSRPLDQRYWTPEFFSDAFVELVKQLDAENAGAA